MNEVNITTQNKFKGYSIQETFGLVNGSVVRTRNVFRDIWEGIKSLFGMELTGYTDVINKSRRTAIERMVADAQDQGANAIVGVRLSTSAITPGASEVLAYGTAVSITPKPNPDNKARKGGIVQTAEQYVNGLQNEPRNERSI